MRRREFIEEKFGDHLPVETRDAYEKHVVMVLESAETMCCTTYSTVYPEAQGDLFYHPSTNTLVAIPANPSNEPTAYRPEDGVGYFYLKTRNAMAVEQREIPIVQSIYELRPELAAVRDTQLRDDIERRFEHERAAMLKRHEEQLRSASFAEAEALRHAQELRRLEESKSQEFDRRKREQENTRDLREREWRRLTTEQSQTRDRKR
ncbi:MAG: hypothetical protein WDO56_00100 [Gammaproteobacteria bacterium]